MIIVLEKVLEPHQVPLNILSLFDLVLNVRQKLEEVVRWEVRADKRDRLSWDALEYMVHDFVQVQFQRHHEGIEVVLGFNVYDNVFDSYSLVDLHWVETCRLEQPRLQTVN